MILVQATFESVAKALCHVQGATIWQESVFEQELN